MTKLEITKKTRAWEYAKASCLLENCSISKKTEAIIQKHITGKISDKELDVLMIESLLDPPAEENTKNKY